MNALLARFNGLVIVALLLVLGGCGEAEKDLPLEPVAFHAEDECHVCGMVIADFPGPKGQAVEKDGVRKFCSAAEMLGWWLQPENRLLDVRLYVHDMGQGSWEQPDDAHLVDAATAYYVTGAPLKGAMGAVLATFADEQAAVQLAEQHGGQVLRLADIDQELLQRLQQSSASHAHGHGEANEKADLPPATDAAAHTHHP